MKIYYCGFGMIGYNPSALVVASSEEGADKLFRKGLEENDIQLSDSILVKEVDFEGYDITITKK